MSIDHLYRISLGKVPSIPFASDLKYKWTNGLWHDFVSEWWILPISLLPPSIFTTTKWTVGWSEFVKKIDCCWEQCWWVFQAMIQSFASCTEELYVTTCNMIWISFFLKLNSLRRIKNTYKMRDWRLTLWEDYFMQVIMDIFLH